MGIIIRQSIRNAFISYGGTALGFIITIKFFTSILSESQYGLTRALLAFMLIGIQFILIGSQNSIIKFFPELSARTKKPRSIFFLFLVPVLIAFIVFSGTFFAFKPVVVHYFKETELFSEYALYVLPLILFMSLFNLLDSYIKAQLDTVFASFLLEISLRLIILADLLLYDFDVINFEQFMKIFVANYGLQFLFLFGYAFREKLFEFSFPRDLVSIEQFKRIGNYGIFSFFSATTIVLIGNVDVLMLSTLTDFSQTGIYAIAFYIGAVIAIPRKAVQKIAFPMISKSFQANDLDNVADIYAKSSLNQFLFGVLIYIGVWANLHNLFAILPASYSSISFVILVIGAANLFDLITGTNSQIIHASDHYRFDLFATIGLVIVGIVLNFILIPKFGINGAALATACSILLYNLLKLLFIWKKLSMHPFQWKTAGIFMIAAAILYASFFIPYFDNEYVDLMIRSISIALVYFTLILFFNLSNDVSRIYKSMLNRVFAK